MGQIARIFQRGYFPCPQDEDRKYFLSDEYRGHMQCIREREADRCYFLFFQRDGQDIGIALPAIFTSEDGKCFIMEYCVFPEHRGGGTGRACARVLMEWASKRGAEYYELNSGGNERRERFWKSLGFIPNGHDEWGEPLMILPPQKELTFTVEVLTDPEDWQMLKLENGFKIEIGEEALSEDQQNSLQQAVREGKIIFFLARRGYRAVGMCSLARSWSTFSCSDTGIFEDFYIEPAFRKKGIARMLVCAAQSYCRKNGIPSLTVTCADCDRDMYTALGFDINLGTGLAAII